MVMMMMIMIMIMTIVSVEQRPGWGEPFSNIRSTRKYDGQSWEWNGLLKSYPQDTCLTWLGNP